MFGYYYHAYLKEYKQQSDAIDISDLMMMMMTALNSLARQKGGGSGRGGGRGEISKKGTPNRNSDARSRSSYRSNSGVVYLGPPRHRQKYGR